MKFSAAAILATMATTVVASPVTQPDTIVARQYGTQCCYHNEQWYYAWGYDCPSWEQWVCYTLPQLPTVLRCYQSLTEHETFVPVSFVLQPPYP